MAFYTKIEVDFMYNLEIIEQRIMYIAKKLGLSKNKLLINANLSKGLFDTMKKGQVPSVEKIHKIAEYLNCSVDFILGRTKTSRLVKDLPDKIIDIIMEQYSKNPKEFISDEFVKAPTKTMKH